MAREKAGRQAGPMSLVALEDWSNGSSTVLALSTISEKEIKAPSAIAWQYRPVLRHDDA
jgi:hypothetical protein